jgi:tetratricopeptide (TPR) repeat protein
MNSSLTEKIIKLHEEGALEEEIERILDQHLIKYPDDVEAWVRLSVLVFESPIGDFEKSINCLRKAVEVKPDYLEALLILMRMQNYIYREIDEDLYKLLHHYQPRSCEEQSLIEYAKAWYFEGKKMDEEYARHLEKSISAYPKYVLNHISLGKYYLKKNQKEKAKSHFLKGM